jgi:hypothetical protein
LIAGYIIQYDGYQWTFGVCAIFFGIIMIAVVLLVPETAYRRNSLVLVPVEDAKDPDHVVHMKLAHEHDAEPGSEKASYTSRPAAGGATEKKKTYIQSLAVFTGVHSSAPMWKIFLRPFVLLLYPAVLWAFLVYGEFGPASFATSYVDTDPLQAPPSPGSSSSPSSTASSSSARRTTSPSARPG